MKTRTLLVICFALLCLSAAPAMAELTLQQALDSITLLPTPGVSSVNVATDTIADGLDSYWAITGGASSSTVVMEIAGWAGSNTFGVYDMTNQAKWVQVFAGGASSGDSAMLSIMADGSVKLNNVDTLVDFAGNAFGYYLTSLGGTFYSDTLLNGDAYDHMWALQGKGDLIQIPTLIPSRWNSNEYVLAWEDTWQGGDFDHQDLVVMVESVEPVPVPAAVLLGMLGLSVAGVKLRKFA